MYLYWLKNGVKSKKKKRFLHHSWNLFSNSFVTIEENGFMCFAVHRTVFSPCIKMHEVISHHLSWHCSACHALVPALTRLIVHCVGVLLRGGCNASWPGCVRPVGCRLDTSVVVQAHFLLLPGWILWVLYVLDRAQFFPFAQTAFVPHASEVGCFHAEE